MDVIAMRKTSGKITGNIALNGHDQERVSFLRSSGYVEQFDTNSPELTVRETVEFSGRLRLDANNPAIGDDATKIKYVDNVLSIMELTDIQNLQVGSFEEGELQLALRVLILRQLITSSHSSYAIIYSQLRWPNI